MTSSSRRSSTNILSMATSALAISIAIAAIVLGVVSYRTQASDSAKTKATHQASVLKSQLKAATAKASALAVDLKTFSDQAALNAKNDAAEVQRDVALEKILKRSIAHLSNASVPKATKLKEQIAEAINRSSNSYIGYPVPGMTLPANIGSYKVFRGVFDGDPVIYSIRIKK